MSNAMVLIMIDECGEEVEYDRYNIGSELDEDYLDIWKSMKIEKAREDYPEARGFYFEDRRNWSSTINAMIRDDEGYDPWEDEEVEV